MCKAAEIDADSTETAAIVRHIVHELRQPLSTIEAIAYYLKLTIPPNQARAREQAGKLQQVVDQANSILTDAIFFLESATPKPELVDLSGLVSEMLDQPSDGGCHVHREVELCHAAPARLDPAHLRYLIRNLLGFFTQIARPDGSIKVRTVLTGAEAVLLLSAEGRSVAPAALRNIFEPFSQSLPGEGGLPMASVRRIVDAHAGRIDARAESDHAFSLHVAFPRD